jgi:hypothetical protein
MEDDSFYVRISEPIEFRRNLLLSSRALIEMLKQSERINEIRDEKLKNMGELRMIVEEIVLLNSRLKSNMPKTKMKSVPFKKLSRMASPKQANLAMLESELGKIEERLGSL